MGEGRKALPRGKAATAALLLAWRR